MKLSVFTTPLLMPAKPIACRRRRTDQSAHVQADYLFGRPVAGLTTELATHFEPVPVAPTGWSGWAFGDTASYRGNVSPYPAIGAATAAIKSAADDIPIQTIPPLIPKVTNTRCRRPLRLVHRRRRELGIADASTDDPHFDAYVSGPSRRLTASSRRARSRRAGRHRRAAHRYRRLSPPTWPSAAMTPDRQRQARLCALPCELPDPASSAPGWPASRCRKSIRPSSPRSIAAGTWNNLPRLPLRPLSNASIPTASSSRSSIRQAQISPMEKPTWSPNHPQRTAISSSPFSATPPPAHSPHSKS